jgi:mediator of RNA polymerase II transcription subunit 12
MENTASRSTSRSHTVDPAANAKLHDGNSANKHNIRQSDTLNPMSYSCPEAKVLNSRRKKRLGFAVHSVQASSEPTPQFIQPSKVYYRARYPGTPPYPTRGARQKQIQLQPSKSEISKNISRRDKLKPYVLEPPVQAQRFPKNSGCPPHSFCLSRDYEAYNCNFIECCDIYPWKGNHPEDHVTDAQARNGQYDKLFVGKHNVLSAGLPSQTELVLTALQNEQGSARSPLIATFKQRMGLRTLSSLYLNILDKRQSYSAVTTTSTFKPPPRVTLPDQKREAWLRDLANPLVPLRRLSRTIPHGLKGPALLEQCAAKSVPTARAVWFVRCVGANELRGLRRKGVGSLAVGGEAKWIKEWTGHVMQFLEKSIGACGTMSDDLWRTRMHYS